MSWEPKVNFPPPEQGQDIGLESGSVAADWIEYFERQQVIPGSVGLEHRLHQHMKEGKGSFYWSEFVFYGFVNYRSDAIFLAGFPDRPQTQPHHPKFDPGTARLQFVKEVKDALAL
jgi:hypothetical protein